MSCFLTVCDCIPVIRDTFLVHIYNIYPKKRNMHHISPDNKVHGANMGSTWVLSAPDGPHVGPMDLAIKQSWGRFNSFRTLNLKYKGASYYNWKRFFPLWWSSWQQPCALIRISIPATVWVNHALIVMLIGTTWGPSGADSSQVGPMNTAYWVDKKHLTLNIKNHTCINPCWTL